MSRLLYGATECSQCAEHKFIISTARAQKTPKYSHQHGTYTSLLLDVDDIDWFQNPCCALNLTGCDQYLGFFPAPERWYSLPQKPVWLTENWAPKALSSDFMNRHRYMVEGFMCLSDPYIINWLALFCFEHFLECFLTIHPFTHTFIQSFISRCAF